MTLCIRDFVFNSLILFLLDAFLFLWVCVHVCACAVKVCVHLPVEARGHPQILLPRSPSPRFPFVVDILLCFGDKDLQ